ncbi:MAG: tRNA pseudouridine55 synthase [Fimbriimonadaceae bacterium]|nr:tRNA pseudouridine55 synthase [Fimbriimonadaceae bacterium]
MLGILLIDKPLGITSHDVVNAVRRKFGTKRVGHAGTLDPLGSGLLVVAVGPATRFLQYLPLEPKEYEGTITFGKRTDSYDAEGQVVSEAPVPDDLAARLHELHPRFAGLIEQLPPMFSAVKIGGQPLYKYARKGEEIERKSRMIHISSLEFVSVDGADVDFRLVCSGGTYVRTLADDLGQAVGCGAYLTRLRRTRVGRFSISGAVPLDQISPDRLMPLRDALDPMQVLPLSSRQTHAIREGQQVSVDGAPTPGLVALSDPEGQVFSVARLLGNLVQPECVIPSETLDGSL